MQSLITNWLEYCAFNFIRTERYNEEILENWITLIGTSITLDRVCLGLRLVIVIIYLCIVYLYCLFDGILKFDAINIIYCKRFNHLHYDLFNIYSNSVLILEIEIPELTADDLNRF